MCRAIEAAVGVSVDRQSDSFVRWYGGLNAER